MRARALVLPGLLAIAIPLASAPDQPAPSGKIEESEVHLVLVDTIVTGEGGRPVPGLKKENFTLRIDGKNAPVAFFEDHCAAPPAAPVESEAPASTGGPTAAPGPETDPNPKPTALGVAEPPPAEAKRVVLYFDLPHLSPSGATRSVRAARRYLEASGASSDLYMVAAFGPTTRILAPFTPGRDLVLSALQEVTAPGVTYDEGPVARSSKIQQVTHETCPDPGLRGKCDNQVALARDYAREEEAVARRSLDALRAMMVALASLPGRKALIFFTESLRDEPGAYYLAIANTMPRTEQISIDVEFRAAVEEANAASVSFYPVYAPGLDDSSDTEFTRSVTGVGTKAERQPTLAEMALQRNFMASGTPQMKADVGPIADAQRSAEAGAVGFNASVAAETGGRHLGRTNDLAKVFPIVSEDLSCYYVLSYAPPPPADGKKHPISVSVDRKGLEVRSRQYFTDWPPESRVDRRIQTALAAPGAFQDIRVKLDAFALGRAKQGRQVLIEASVPAADLSRSASGIPPDDGAAIVRLRGRVTTETKEACAFTAEFPVAAVAAAASHGAALHYEAACSLPPGPYEISAAVMEKRGGALGAARREIGVPALHGFQVLEPQLWASASSDLVFREQAAEIFGTKKGVVPGAASPRSERRLMPGEKGSLLVLVCPSEKGPEPAAGPITVTRAILSGETPVATFPPLKLSEAPDPASGCWGITSEIRAGTLGEGIYTFNYELFGGVAGGRISRSAAFAVGAAAADPSTAPAPEPAPIEKAPEEAPPSP